MKISDEDKSSLIEALEGSEGSREASLPSERVDGNITEIRQNLLGGLDGQSEIGDNPQNFINNALFELLTPGLIEDVMNKGGVDINANDEDKLLSTERASLAGEVFCAISELMTMGDIARTVNQPMEFHFGKFEWINGRFCVMYLKSGHSFGVNITDHGEPSVGGLTYRFGLNSEGQAKKRAKKEIM